MQRKILEQQQIPNNGPDVMRISAQEFAAKFKSKRECYMFVASENDIYVPPYGKCRFTTRLTPYLLQTTSRFTS